ncbi:acyl-CoA ligase FadD12 [Actinomadura viridis]|uniref:Fatty-acyl-CoA synthase n=1 Tax=Actinomadura viridis TaxID=58110 RepID=A0A931GPH4_9ACTN|nr:AMP-binding protein [Actinomadura viridis]MBG6087409.1 fatty-acyl-CoA synthase [Actinomadura viridis]
MLLDRMRTMADLGTRAVRAVRDTGALHPVRPDRAVRMPLPYLRYGPAPATIGAMAALRFPGRTAIIDERGTLTYAELDRRAAGLAAALGERLTGGRIGVLCRNHRGFAEAVLAASRIGHDVVLLNTDFSAPQLGEVAEREGVELLIHDEEFGDVVRASSFGGRRILAWHEGTAEETIDALAERGPARPARTGTRTGRVIVLTSGTTGTPKGARHDLSIGRLLPVALTHMARVPIRSGAPMVIAPPLFHVLGFAYMTVGLGLGTPLVLSRRFDPERTLEAIEEHRAETLVAVPVMLRRMLDVPDGPRPASLRVVVCGGSALHPHLSEEFMDAFGDVLRNVYGATETGWATIATPQDLREAPGTVGRPSFRLTVRILGEDGRELPAGEVGEIYTGGGLRFAGYTGGGGKRVRGGLTGTGDLGHFDADGRLFVDGRADDMIVSGGENVFPGEVEELLGRHPGVAEVSVTGVDDTAFDQRLAAYVVRAPGATVTGDALKAHVKEHLARYKVPREVHFVDELPRTSTGKVQARGLPS